MLQSPVLNRAMTPHQRCEEDQDNEAMFFDAMYGQDDRNTFVILKPSEATTSDFVFLPHDSEVLESEIPNHVFEQRVTSESPNPISQLSVRLQFRLIKTYPIDPPLIGCKSLIGANRDQCVELLKFLNECAVERVGQVMLFDLVLAAGEWLSAKVRESHQGSLHESMLETERLKKVEHEKLTEQKRAVTEQERRVSSTLHALTPQRESELRRQWLQSHDVTAPSRPVGLRGQADPMTFAGNLSYTMSRFMKTQNGAAQLKGALSGGASASASLLQTIQVLQQGLVQQQMLVSHLLAQWCALVKEKGIPDPTSVVLEYLRSESLLDEKQADMVQFPGRIPVTALFPNAAGSIPAVALLSTPAERLSVTLPGLTSAAPTATHHPESTQLSSLSEDAPSPKQSRYDQDFEEISYCGSGSFGDVMKVRNRLDGIFYAVKRVRIGRIRGSAARDTIANNKMVNRILREVTTLGRIQSPYVLRYHQAWIEETPVLGESGSRVGLELFAGNAVDNTLRSSSFYDYHGEQTCAGFIDENSAGDQEVDGGTSLLSLFIQTAYCPKTLADYLQTEARSASVADLWRLCRMTLEGLAHIHSYGIMHRDLKPSNIFIDSNGDIRIGDFGLATFDTDDLGDDVTPDDGGGGGVDRSKNVGTKLYASPEQENEAGGDYDERTDVFSLGIIIFEIWHPFRTTSERIDQISKLKQGCVGTSVFSKFAESHPRQWKLIQTMLRINVHERPTATTILQSDLLPPRMEDDFLNDALRVVGNPNTPVFPRILAKLFAPDRQGVLSKQQPDSAVMQPLGQYLSLLPEPVVLAQRKEFVSAVFRSVFERHGAVRVATPLFSPWIASAVPAPSTAVLMDSCGSLLSLRHDSRSFFCRTMADAFANPLCELQQNVLFKRYDLGTVFRKPPRSGAQPIQLLRADFDAVGVDPVTAEIECMCIVSEIAVAFNADVEWIRIRISHVALFGFVLDQADLKKQQVGKVLGDSALASSSCARIDRWEGLRKALIASALVSDKQANVVGRWFRTSTGDVADAIAAVRDAAADDAVVESALADVERLMGELDRVLGSDFREKQFMLDLTSPPPGDDYDGLFFRVDMAFHSQPDVGESVAVGGRFDRALGSGGRMAGISWNVSKFVSNATVPASGILSAPDVLVCSLYDAKAEESSAESVGPRYSVRTEQIATARELWKAGIATDVFYGTNSLQEQIEFATNRGVKYVVLIREKDLQPPTAAVEGSGSWKRSDPPDYVVSLRVLTGAKPGKQIKEQFMRVSEVAAHIAHTR